VIKHCTETATFNKASSCFGKGQQCTQCHRHLSEYQAKFLWYGS
jgi:hypothetical protein